MKLQLLFLFVFLTLNASLLQTVRALPFSYIYTETIIEEGFDGVSVGDSASIIVTLDNGGSSDVSQTWTASDLQSITFNFNDGGLLTIFNSPFDAGLVDNTGVFSTDSSGMLTSVMQSWFDDPVTADFTTNSTLSVDYFRWFLNGKNAVYIEIDNSGAGATVRIDNVETILDPTKWSRVTAIPTPTPVPVPLPTMTLALIGLGFAGIGLARKRETDSIVPGTEGPR